MSVKQTETGSWKVRYYEAGRGSRRRGKTFERRKDALLFDAEVKRRHALGELALLDAGTQTVEDLILDWWRDYAVSNLGQRTRRDYKYVLDLHINPRLGGLRLRDLTHETIQRFRTDLERKGVGRSTVRRSLVVLQAVCRSGVEWGRLSRNPVAAVRKPPGQRQRAVAVLPPEAVEAIRGKLRGGNATLVSVLAYAGLRPQEALALEWRHVRERTLLVEQKNVDGRIVLGQKTRRSARTVDLLAPLRDDLVEWQLRSGRRSGLVFPARNGNAWREHDWLNWNRRVWKGAREAIGLTEPPYSLRHSFASLLIHEGLSVVEVAEQLGHSPGMTLSTYAHVFREFKGSERVSAEEAIRAARGPSVDPQSDERAAG